MSGQLSISATEFLLLEEKLLSLLLAAFPPNGESDDESSSTSETPRASRDSSSSASASLPLALSITHEIMRKLRKRVTVSFVEVAKDEVRRRSQAASSASSSDTPSTVSASLADIDESLAKLKRSREELHSLVRHVPKRARVVIDGMLAEQYDVDAILADVADSDSDEGDDDDAGAGGAGASKEGGASSRKKRQADGPTNPLDRSVSHAATRLAGKMDRVASTLDALETRVALLAQATLSSTKP